MVKPTKSTTLSGLEHSEKVRLQNAGTTCDVKSPAMSVATRVMDTKRGAAPGEGEGFSTVGPEPKTKQRLLFNTQQRVRY